MNQRRNETQIQPEMNFSQLGRTIPGALVADDLLVNLYLSRVALSGKCYKIKSVNYGIDVLTMILNKRYALILIDDYTSSSCGLDVLKLRQSYYGMKPLPGIVFMPLSSMKSPR
jgi:CheY-like chemotaxis protein